MLDDRDANSRFAQTFDAMNEFFLSIPNFKRANLDGGRSRPRHVAHRNR
jgi:hypothetical protein